MKPLRPAVAAVILTALLAVPAYADHKRFGGFFVEPYFKPLPQRPFRGRLRRQDGYPVALVRKRLRGIGFYGIGRFDVYSSAYGVTATDPGGVRVRMVIDRWTGDIVRAREIEDVPVARSYKPPVVVGRAPTVARETVALRRPPLPRPAPERLTQTANIAPSAADNLPLAVEDEEILTSSIDGVDVEAEIDPTGPISMPPPLPGVEAEAPRLESEAPVEITAAPKPPAIAETDPVAPKPAWQATAPQGERFDPADGRDPIADY